VPVAVGRTAAVAVGRLPESNLVMRIARGRAWIPVLGVLLAGIVALNVGTLALSTGSGKTLQRRQQLRNSNSELRSKLARRLSAENLEKAAAKIGLIVPDPGAIRYLRTGGSDASTAARRLRAGMPVDTTLAATTPVAQPTTPVTPAATPQPTAQVAQPQTPVQPTPVQPTGATQTAGPTATTAAPPAGGVATPTGQ
jgi:hypothetical protein